MSKTLNIIAHLERLWPTYSANFVDFALNVGLAFNDGDSLAATDGEFVKTWKAAWSDVQLYSVPSDPNQLPTPITGIALLPATDVNRQVVVNAFQDRFPMDSSRWTINPNAINDKRQRKIPVNENSQPWLAFQVQQSRGPAGIPVAVGLTLVVRIPASALVGDEIVGAPVFGSASQFGATVGPKKPNLPVNNPSATLHRVTQQTDKVQSYLWQYDTTAFDVVETVNGCRWNDPPPSTDASIDLNTLWIKPAANPLDHSRDWTSDLEHKLADAFDVPQRLLDFLIANKSIDRSVVRTVHAVFMRTLHDSANSGADPEPDGRTLAEELLKQTGGPPGMTIEEALKLLRQLDSQLDVTSSEWLKIVQDVVRQVDPLAAAAFPVVPDNDTNPLDDYLVRLAHLRSTMAQQSALLELLLTEWKQVFQNWPELENKVTPAAANIDLRKRILLANVNQHWRGISGPVSDTTLEKTLLDQLTGYIEPLYGNILPKELTNSLQEFSHSFVQKIAIPSDPGDSSHLAEQLVMQVADMQSEPEPGTDQEADDPVRRVAGIGVLLRSSDEWSCLNLADVEAQGNTVLQDPCPIPLQLQYRNGMRQSFVSYANQPMVSSVKNRLLAQKGTFIPTAANLGAQPGVFEYLNPYTKNGPRLAGLFYKRPYDAALFLYGAAGNLPATIADPNAPWKFKQPVKTADLPAQHPQFLRRVPLGAVRISPLTDQGGIGDFSVPAIPANVRPLARSIEPLLPELGGNKPIGERRSVPLILLLPSGADQTVWNSRLAGDHFSFKMQPPSVDWSVWYRWVGPGKDTATNPGDISRTQCRDVIAAWARSNDLIPQKGELKSQEDKKQKPPATIDDPAVAQLVLELYKLSDGNGQVYSKHDQPIVSPLPCPLIPNDPKSGPMAIVQSLARTVRIASSTGNPLLQLASDNAVNVAVGLGVWRLRVRPDVRDKDRFHPSVQALIDGSENLNYGEQNLLIEVASDWPMRNNATREAALQAIAVELTRALKPSLAGAFTNSKKLATANLASTDAIAVEMQLQQSNLDWGSMIQRVDVIAQQWRWDGRPLFKFDPPLTAREEISQPPRPVKFGFPLSPPPTTGDEQYPPDAVLFGSRDSSDSEHNPKELDCCGQPAQSYSVYKKDVSAFPGAQYFRFGIAIQSRYSGLMLKGDTINSISGHPDHLEHWNRLFVPCRSTQTLPKPAIKLVLPLTETWDNTDIPSSPAKSRPETPGLIVLLDEPWYGTTYGLAEYMESSIEEVRRPEIETDVRLQFGPDPIVAMPNDPSGGLSIELPEVVGAFGYTFDEGSFSPLWVRSSFYQPPPEIQDDNMSQSGPGDTPKQFDLSWHFVKLRFRRILDAAALDQQRRPLSLVSEWTDPVWAQLLPPSDLVRIADGQTVPIDELVFDAVAGTISRRSGGSVVPQPTPTDSSHGRFDLYGLLTMKVTDVAGRSGQETAFAIVPQVNSHPKWPPVNASQASRVRLRLIEVQYRAADSADRSEHVSSLQDFTKLLFPALDGSSGPIDASARIVRVWNPIGPPP